MEDSTERLRQELAVARRKCDELSVRLFEDHHDFNARIDGLEKNLYQTRMQLDGAVRAQADMELAKKLVQHEITEREARYKGDIEQIQARLHKQEALNKVLRNEATARAVALQNTQAMYDEVAKNLGQATNHFAEERKALEDHYIRQIEESKLYENELHERAKSCEDTIKVLRAEAMTKATALSNAQALYNDVAEQLGRAANIAATERRALEDHFHHEIEGLKNHEAEMTATIHQLEETVKMLRSDINQKTAQLAELKNVAANLDKEMNKRVKNLEREIEQLRHLMGERDSAAERLQRAADEAMKQTQQARKERDEVRFSLGHEVDGLRKQLVASETLVSDLRKLLSERDSAAERLQRNADDAKRATQETRRERDNIRSELGAEVDAGRAAVHVLQTDVDAKTKALATIQDDVAKLRNTLADRDAKLRASTQTTTAAIQAQLQAKTTEMGELSAANTYMERLLLLVAIALPVSSWLDKKARL